ncbi:Uncharacterized protein BP5553_02794 [Venustampulla echinocandica]|uniref:Nitrogen regulatory protein areA GATA-like domain-containing protein n=1 Tax=Venustampulla echinocandica TaxID=2656787 RepID=A0A370TSH9_9HELO|nr:Uncharacterized protein BP5553_02794 [Venustampulla echinocandica]RDL38454.1 Uncharacterized protein BP5553_02794 [Venustampulla echinocandica]
MAVVLNSEENNYFSNAPLRRSHSQPKFVTQSSYSSSPSRSKSSTAFNTLISPSDSTPSSAPSSPRTIHADSTAPSFSSTPASSLSLDAHCDDETDEDQILFPSYDEVGYYDSDQVEDLEPPASPRTGDSYTVSPTSGSTSTNASRPGSPVPVEHAEDDTAVRIQPSRHVDYLSHNWKEEDIWSSWKLIVSKRGVYNNSARLENASWRTWMKSKNKLKTISPETLNWLKDCDVTWLYGPLQSGSDKALRMPSASPISSSRLSKSNSFLNKKPILKKRSMSEIMLRKSLSSSSLLKQAAAAVQAQQTSVGVMDRSGVRRDPSVYGHHFPSPGLSHLHTSAFSSAVSSGLASPGARERKHIHFNEQVEQCIAVEVKGDDDDDDPELYNGYDYDDSDSDDGGVMMKRSDSKRKLPPLQSKKTQRQNSTTENKTIAMLPSTTLKYREDSPDGPDSAMSHNAYWTGTKLSPSPSQETLRPSKPSSRMLLGDDEDDDEDLDWQPNSSSRRDSVTVNQDRLGSLHKSGSSSSLTNEPSGMRRTPSGMFMPCEEDEDDRVSEGLFGKVVDTVNTAKDIAHVIWNVGWRR